MCVSNVGVCETLWGCVKRCGCVWDVVGVFEMLLVGVRCCGWV